MTAYGAAHQRTRAVLLPRAIGTPCPICGLTMQRWQALDLDHSNPALKRTGQPGDRITHAHCNRAKGASRIVNPADHTPSRDW